MSAEFSKDGKYFAGFSSDGKLKIWNTNSNSFVQEFTPNFHLTSPCTCLHFISGAHKYDTPKRKKRRNSITSDGDCNLVLGTASGTLLEYSVTKADIISTIKSEINQSINCLSTYDGDTIYTASDQTIIVWSIQKKTTLSHWMGGTDKITAILITPTNRLLTGSKVIKLWDLNSKQVLRTYTGHSQDISFLRYVDPKGNSTNGYAISGSKGDRILACWNLNEKTFEKNAVANFLMEDVVQNISINISTDGITSMAATVRSGVVHIYQYKLNGKCGKPLKPKTTIQLVTNSSGELVKPIYIVGAYYKDNETLCIGYGSEIVKIFENITITNSQKVQCLIRDDPELMSQTKDSNISKIVTPKVNNDVHYVTPIQSIGSSSTGGTTKVSTKRKTDGNLEVPMEKRLENLTLNKLDTSNIPKADNVAMLLLQGLHSKDKNMLRTVLLRKDETVIKNTIKRLPMAVIIPFIEELTTYIQGKTLSSQIGCLWLKNLVTIHAGLLVSNPDLSNLLSPILGNIEHRLTLQTPLNRLKGRLDLLASQINSISSQENCPEEDALLIYYDKESSDSENDLMDENSGSEIEFMELTSEFSEEES